MTGKKQEKDSGNWSDIIKKVVTVGVGAAFMTEDAIKAAMKDIPVPKEILLGLVQNAKTSKEDIFSFLKEELQGHLSKLDYERFFESILDKYDLDVQMKVKFKRKKNKASTDHE